MNFKKIKLKNGLRVILAPMQETQTVTAQILVQTGSKYETKNISGISHFLEHMVFKGTRKRPLSKMAMEEIEGVGGMSNAFTGKEQTGYYVKTPSKHWKLALDVVSDIFLNPLIPAKEIEKERGVILQEESMYQDTPMRYVWDVFEELLYGDQPAGWNIVGNQESIRSISRKDLIEYFKKYYSLSSSVLILAGDFEEEKVLKEIEKIFNKRKNIGKRNSKKKVLEKQSGSQVKIHYKETDQTHLLMGFRSCDMFSEDRFAAVLAGVILGGGMSSRLFDLLREKHGLTYYVDAASEQMTDTGYFFARAGVEHANLEKVIKLILGEIKRLKNKKVSKKELKNAKEFLKGKNEMGLESSSAVASFLGDQELFRGKIRQPEELFAEIDKVAMDDIIKVAEKYFVSENLNLAVIGPHKNQEKLQKILKV